jgi:hypothetical protein
MAAIFFIISSDWLQVFRHPDRLRLSLLLMLLGVLLSVLCA